MKEKYMKIKQLKIGIQMREAALRKLDECGVGNCYDVDYKTCILLGK